MIKLNAREKFQLCLGIIYAKNGFSQKKVAAHLGCDPRTVAAMSVDPFSAKGEYVIRVLEEAQDALREVKLI